jgi:chemotaxis protein MotB
MSWRAALDNAIEGGAGGEGICGARPEAGGDRAGSGETLSTTLRRVPEIGFFNPSILPFLHSAPKNPQSGFAIRASMPARHKPFGDRAMKMNLATAARVVPLTAWMLGACVSEHAYEQQTQQLQAAQAQSAAQQQEIAKMQAENKWVVAGDTLFPEGGYQLSPNGQAALNQYVPQLQNLKNAKVVVYGYTDNLPVGPALQQAGVKNNIDLSSRRADNVVAYLESKGVNPNIISAKGFGDTHPVASNDTPDGRAKNRRIEIVMEGPGA